MKFLLVEDHALFRQGLRLLLARLPGEHDFLEADTCQEAFRLAGAHDDIDVILLDIVLPGMNGLDGLVRLRALRPEVPVVLLSADDSSQAIVESLQRGARGFIPKSAQAGEMVAAIQRVMAGDIHVPLPLPLDREWPAESPHALTMRQREVLALLVQNRSNKEIADALGMQVNTVRVHLAAIFRALGVDNRNDAARVALGLGLLAQGR